MEINRNPAPAQLRVFAVTWLIVFSMISAWLYRNIGSPTAATAVLAGALIVGTGGLFAPLHIRWVYLAMAYATFPLGWLGSIAVLAVVYFLVLTPIGWVLRLKGRHLLDPSPDAKAASYWNERPPPPALERYFDLF